MTLQYILDTDHVSLLQRGHPLLSARFAAVAADAVAVTMITVDEQLHGRLAVIRQAKTQRDAARGYARLYDTLFFFRDFSLVLYDGAAADRFDALRRQGIRIGTQDLRIAVIALERNVTLLTANARDFRQVPGLVIADWTQPTP